MSRSIARTRSIEPPWPACDRPMPPGRSGGPVITPLARRNCCYTPLSDPQCRGCAKSMLAEKDISRVCWAAHASLFRSERNSYGQLARPANARCVIREGPGNYSSTLVCSSTCSLHSAEFMAAVRRMALGEFRSDYGTIFTPPTVVRATVLAADVPPSPTVHQLLHRSKIGICASLKGVQFGSPEHEASRWRNRSPRPAEPARQ